jgi:isochorismate pyruvate lyase
MKPSDECEDLPDVRAAIDALDREIVALIGRRAGYVRAAARFKTTDRSVRAPERQRAMLEDRRRWAAEEGLDPEVVSGIFQNPIGYFVTREMEGWRGRIPSS